MSQGPGVLVESSILDGQLIRAISFLEPEADWDSGFAIWTSAPDQIGNTELVHVGCILDEWPDLANAFMHAREHGGWHSETG